MDFLAEQFLHRIKLAVQGSRGRGFAPQWLCEHTAHPRNTQKRWTFEGHEFQRAILSSPAPEVTCKKCSQVGVSEIFARWALALAAMMPGIQLIYTLPTGGFANKFCKTRVDPVIAASPTLKGLVNSDVDSSLLKQIGQAFIHFVGTFVSTAPISIPAYALFHDEVNFSDQEILATYSSRLGHEIDGGLKARFSTPTVTGFGISALFEDSSQARYAVRCAHCEQWQIPDFFQHAVIPGLDKPVREWDKSDLKNPRYLIDEAYLACPGCRGDLSAVLIDPKRRAWVHAYPDKAGDHAGFQVVPFDVPTINTVPRVLKRVEGYRNVGGWHNFALGEDYEDADSTFLMTVVERMTTGTLIPPPVGHMGPTLLGMDIGKVAHIALGRPTFEGGVEVLYLARLALKDCPDGLLAPKVLELIRRYRTVKSVIDAMPDFSTANHVVAMLPEGMSYGCYYRRSRSTATLSHLTVKASEGVLQVSRTESFNELSQRVNRGLFRFPRCREMTEVKQHLSNLKRTPVDEHGNAAGEGGQGMWVSTGPDHYAHALNYLNLAWELFEQRQGFRGAAVLPMVSGVRMKETVF